MSAIQFITVVSRYREYEGEGVGCQDKVLRVGCGTCPKHISQSARIFSYSSLWQQPPLQLDYWLAVDSNEHHALQTSDKLMLCACMHSFIQPWLHSRLLVGCWFQRVLHPFLYVSLCSFIILRSLQTTWTELKFLSLSREHCQEQTNKQKHDFTITQAISWQLLT